MTRRQLLIVAVLTVVALAAVQPPLQAKLRHKPSLLVRENVLQLTADERGAFVDAVHASSKPRRRMTLR